ncbi:hypothetical protein SPRG_02207 [Saprolegnia parasitica CBS 223.65]|uniref:Amine oxidase domain-containing protein n=1 Tax=Saprolegnia parasitica (strain CBS 223.65) TaxID=695850 RepID=A0A067CVW0_SAPPC|nr:hypothetical protein SPRG_02207 [Saprolegnia parasitica CBS 223.65]KDO33400.1 hypothetical protein SPRG_02207 [Saprolegnia parasitica CBS 223.65]|eukprot:XP_012196148.1 hypothetical protein SPRG_02207 [Saprolegnia parasitica CBS 223.65]
MVDPALPKRIVIVGSGVTGLTAARTICKYSDSRVTLVEAAPRLGGHAYTIDGPSGERMDIGFMVMNNLTYPNLNKLFADIGAEVEPSDMSRWAWTLRNVFRPRLWQFISAHGEFAKRGLAFLQDETPRTTTTREFAVGLDQRFVDKWLVPFISAVWSTSHEGAMDFPIQPLLKFMHHHMFLTLETVAWTTPANRSETYVQKLVALCPNLEVRTSSKASRIDDDAKELVLESGERLPYDALILTCSAPEAAALQPPATTRDWLAKFETNPSRIVCHTSSTGMPTLKEDWSSWNVAGTPADGPQVTYWISRLQNLSNDNVFLSLNPATTPEGTFFETTLAHPTMNQSAYEGQLQEAAFQGHKSVYFAGAWLRNGFHEDGAVSGLLAARRALCRDDIPVEFPTLSGLPAASVVGSSHHARLLPADKAYTIDYDMHLHKFDTRCPPPSFHRRDHFGDVRVPIDTCVRRELASRLNYWPAGKIETIVNLRYLGLGFNPLTPYFAYDEAGTLQALLVEVHNTPWNERCLYAMRVLPNDVLAPAVHPKIMHVSPFNAPPGKPTVGEYEFKLVGTSSITVTLREVDTKAVIMTASWKVDYNKSHTIRTGSWRTVWQIYVQAAKLFAAGMAMHAYKAQPKLSLLSPMLFTPILAFMTVAIAFFQADMLVSSLLFGALGPLLAMHHRYHGALIPASGLAYLVLLLAALVAGTSTNFNVSLAISSVLAFAVSIFSTTPADALRLLSYGNLALASAAVASPLPLYVTASATYLNVLYLWAARQSTANAVGGYAIATQAALASSVVQSLLAAPSETLLASSHSLLATHLGFSFLEPSSNWEFYAHAIIVGVIALLHPWEPVLFSWPLLTGLLLLQAGVGTAWAFLSRSPAFLAKRDALVTHVLQAAVLAATSGRLLLVQEVPANPTAQVVVLKQPFAFFEALLANGELGLGEAFVRNEWELGPNATLTDVLHTLAAANLQDNLVVLLLPYLSPTFYLRRAAFLLKFGDLDRTQSANSIAEHYDDGNALFKAFLGDDMVYTSASWDGLPPNASLRDAQRHKVQRMLSLTQAQPGEKLLDIGSGWGFLVHAAREAGIEATGLCNCRSMVAAARERYGDALFSLRDYRDIPATHEYAAVTAVEMIEAVPAAHYGDFAAACYRALKPGGRVVLQVIHAYAFNNPVARSRTPVPLGTFVTTHIFPGQQVPNLDFLHEAFMEHKFKRVFTETRSHDYAETLRLWAENLDAYRHALPPTVYRKYKYYLNWCEVGFSIEKLHLSRVVFEKPLDEPKKV